MSEFSIGDRVVVAGPEFPNDGELRGKTGTVVRADSRDDEREERLKRPPAYHVVGIDFDEPIENPLRFLPIVDEQMRDGRRMYLLKSFYVRRLSGKFSVGDRVVVTNLATLMGKTGTIACVDYQSYGTMWNGVIFDEPEEFLHDLSALNGEPLCENHHGYWLLDDMISPLEDDVSDIEVGNIEELIGGFS